MKKIILYNALSWFYCLLCLFYKGFRQHSKSNKTIVFISFPDLADNSLYVFLHMNQFYRDYELVWLCANITSAKNKLKSLNCNNDKNDIKLVKKNSFAGLLYFVKAKVVFHTHGTYFFVTRSYKSCVVNLWHGMQIKTVGFLDGKSKYDVAYCDYSISTSSFHQTKMAQAFGIDESRVLLSGQPRNDALLVFSDIERASFYHTFDIESDNDIIFWLPTYRVSNVGDVRVDSLSSSFMSDFESGFLYDLNKTLVSNKKTLIIKLHPMDVENSNRILNDTKLSHIRILNQQLWALSPVELYTALAFSSGLISDVSSVIVDYTITGKPIAVIRQAVLDYSRGFVPGLTKDSFLQSFHTITSISTFKDFLQVAQHECPINYPKIFNQFDYNVITSSEYITKYFVDLDNN
ncbi:CDP-glycerol glycerophosphotransferase family protein [Aeromonas veronii]